jgi:hypothetical protein
MCRVLTLRLDYPLHWSCLVERQIPQASTGGELPIRTSDWQNSVHVIDHEISIFMSEVTEVNWIG